ncbi:hypothetical protein BaRGS_00035484 [Batillaria attramentaria]|uniref:Cytochrome P450 n=1 Tax=Batillaria attramentaria TaxID=370345 RepID=A0ABD0JE49_9CAEN
MTVFDSTALLLTGVVLLLSLLLWLYSRRSSRLPPGPGFALPLLGHLHLMGKDSPGDVPKMAASVRGHLQPVHGPTADGRLERSQGHQGGACQASRRLFRQTRNRGCFRGVGRERCRERFWSRMEDGKESLRGDPARVWNGKEPPGGEDSGGGHRVHPDNCQQGRPAL